MSNIKNKASDSEKWWRRFIDKKIRPCKDTSADIHYKLEGLQMLMMAVNKLETLAESDEHKATARS